LAERPIKRLPAHQGRLLPVSAVISRLRQRGFPASKSYIYTLVNTGEIKSIRIGSRQGIRIRETWLDEYIEEKEQKFSIFDS
jgi:excisionase family DNA binding protein